VSRHSTVAAALVIKQCVTANLSENRYGHIRPSVLSLDALVFVHLQNEERSTFDWILRMPVVADTEHVASATPMLNIPAIHHRNIMVMLGFMSAPAH